MSGHNKHRADDEEYSLINYIFIKILSWQSNSICEEVI